MKKSKLSVGLVTTFIGALALSACNETPAVTAKKDTIIDFVDYNQSKDRIEVNTSLYDEIGKTEEGTKLYYNAVLEALIRSQYKQLSEKDDELKSFARLNSEAENKVKAAKQTASDTANSSGTTYDEEWENILESHDCETEEDLKQHYLYDLEKDELTDWYSKSNIKSLKDQYIGVSGEYDPDQGIDNRWKQVPADEKVENVDSVYPYHILHILVTLSADKSDYTRGTITEAEAKNLWAVVRNLIDSNYSFQEIAMNKSDDTGSKDKYGDVEIMSTKTSFYNEFKLGIYAYDAILSGVNSVSKGTEVGDNLDIYQALGLYEETADGYDDKYIVTETTGSETKEAIADLVKLEMSKNIQTAIHKANPTEATANIPTIPYDVFKRIGEVAEDTKIGNTAPEAGDVALPRNVLFNQFLNFHSPFVITNEDVKFNDKGTETFDDDEITLSEHDFVNGTADNDLVIKSTNFNGQLAGKKVLTDKDNNVIIGVRSEAGIHFMVMRKSVFYNTNVAAGREETTLQDYYSTDIPGDDEWTAAKLDSKQTFVNMATTTDKSYYTNRADTIKNELKSTSTFDAAFDYRLYEYLMDLPGITVKFFDEDETTGESEIENNIEKYISRLRETKHESDVDSINSAWESYLRMLRDQNFKRSFDDAMLSTTCAFKFNSNNKALFEKGGACYVEK